MSHTIQDLKNASFHIVGDKRFLILEEGPYINCKESKEIFDFVNSIINAWKDANVYLQLPYNRKNFVEFVRRLRTIPLSHLIPAKYYNTGFFQSWVEHLYSKDFKIPREYLPMLRDVLPTQYDHGLNSFYKRVKKCVPSLYGQTVFDKPCPYDTKHIKIHVIMNVLELDPSDFDRYTHSYLKHLQSIKPLETYLSKDMKIPDKFVPHIEGFKKFLLGKEGQLKEEIPWYFSPTNYILNQVSDALRITNEIKGIKNKIIKSILEKWYNDKFQKMEKYLKDSTISATKLAGYLIGMAYIFSDVYNFANAFSESDKHNNNIYYVKEVHAGYLRKLLDLVEDKEEKYFIDFKGCDESYITSAK